MYPAKKSQITNSSFLLNIAEHETFYNLGAWFY